MKKWTLLILMLACLTMFSSCGQEEVTDNMTVAEFPPEPDPEPVIPENAKDAFGVDEENTVDIDAVWEGYPDASFDVFLENALGAMFDSEEANALKSFDIAVVDGWNCEGFLDESAIAEGNRAVSYVCDMMVVTENGEVNRGLKIYTELTGDGAVNIMGAETFEENMDYGQVYDAAETVELLESIKAYL